MVYKTLVPRTMIPKINPLCPQCQSGTKTTMGTAFADGYHRRHVCQNVDCGYKFYTLTDYDGESYDTSPTAFRDRKLNDYEIALRKQWWEDYEKGNIRVQLPREVMPPLLVRMVNALNMDEAQRNPVDRFLVAGYQALLARVAGMEQQENSNGG